MNGLRLKILKRYAATSLKCVMVLMILVSVISIPWLIATEAWNFLSVLLHEHPLLFIVLLFPTLYLSLKIWQWLYKLVGSAMMSVGSLVDKLEKDSR